MMGWWDIGLLTIQMYKCSKNVHVLKEEFAFKSKLQLHDKPLPCAPPVGVSHHVLFTGEVNLRARKKEIQALKTKKLKQKQKNPPAIFIAGNIANHSLLNDMIIEGVEKI